MKKNVKILLIIPALIILGLVGKYGYDYYSISFEEQEKIKIDEYNFEQLEKVKLILDPLDKKSYIINSLDDFNEQFNMNIKPIKNCYYLIDKNGFFKDKKGEGGYIFGFELESKTYIKKYGTQYFAYPKYDLPMMNMCDGECYDNIRQHFEYIISNPCNNGKSLKELRYY